MAKQITTADLMRKLDALEREITALKALPRTEVHHHYPSYPTYTPYIPARPYQPWQGGTITATPYAPTWTAYSGQGQFQTSGNIATTTTEVKS